VGPRLGKIQRERREVTSAIGFAVHPSTPGRASLTTQGGAALSLFTFHLSPGSSAGLFRLYRFEIVLCSVFDRDDHRGLISISLGIDRDIAGDSGEILGAGDRVA
jgi:hypothetical protein